MCQGLARKEITYSNWVTEQNLIKGRYKGIGRLSEGYRGQRSSSGLVLAGSLCPIRLRGAERENWPPRLVRELKREGSMMAAGFGETDTDCLGSLAGR